MPVSINTISNYVSTMIKSAILPISILSGEAQGAGNKYLKNYR